MGGMMLVGGVLKAGQKQKKSGTYLFPSMHSRETMGKHVMKLHKMTCRYLDRGSLMDVSDLEPIEHSLEDMLKFVRSLPKQGASNA